MSKIIEFVHRICHFYPKYPTLLLGGFCLTGLCFGADYVPGVVNSSGNFIIGTTPAVQQSHLLSNVSDFPISTENTADKEYIPRRLLKKNNGRFYAESPLPTNENVRTMPITNAAVQSLQMEYPTLLVSTLSSQTPTNSQSQQSALEPVEISNREWQTPQNLTATPFNTATHVNYVDYQPAFTPNVTPVSNNTTNVYQENIYQANVNSLLSANQTELAATHSIPAQQPMQIPQEPTLLAYAPQYQMPVSYNYVAEPTPARFSEQDYTADVTKPVVTNAFGGEYITHDELNEILKENNLFSQQSNWRKGAFTITPYGYINVSSSYETKRTVNEDFALYSLSPDLDGGGHSGFHIDPKSSRIGLKVDGPNFNWYCQPLKTSALLEVDFQNYSYGSPRNRGALMLRRAFVDFKRNDTRLLIGQEWEIVSPLVPESLNYVPGSYTGNLGYRRAQVRLERERQWDSGVSTIWQIAVCDNVPIDYLTLTYGKANSGWPLFQGRYAVIFGRNTHADCQPYTVGLSGMLGEQTYDYGSPGLNKRRHEIWAVNLDLTIPLTKRFRFTSEFYTGTNVSSSLAAIGQGIDLFTPGNSGIDPRSADVTGGWLNLNFKATSKFQMNAGYCFEKMDDILGTASISNTLYSARDKNQMLFMNGIYNWTGNFLTGLEVSQWQTDWHAYNPLTQTRNDLKPGKTTRIEFLTRYTF
ncbi:MAG: hypothetical protein LBJ67_14360 [Planctomycetaceae bacterium]|jgi:hypothetical protein|nr:hypothetical protein [Planctomycetaceae bacterium]